VKVTTTKKSKKSNKKMQSRNLEEENKLKPVSRQENVESSVSQDENLVEPPPAVDINQQRRLQREKPTFNEFEASTDSLRNTFGTEEAKNKAPISSMDSCPEVEKRMRSEHAELENKQIGSPVVPSAKSGGKMTMPSSPPSIPRIHLNPDESEFHSFVEPEMDAVSGGSLNKAAESSQMESNANGLK
jgi:hypothetical protein